MMSTYDSIDEALNTDMVKVDTPSEVKVPEKPDEVQKDYEYTRGNLYSLIEKRTGST